MAGQKKKFGLGAGVSAPRSVIGCRDGCGLWRVDVLNDPEMVVLAMWGGFWGRIEALKIYKNTQFRPLWV